MDSTTIVVAGVFVLAGAVKGAAGLGLPPIAMGLLVIVMPPVEAAAVLVLPSFVTNAWQMLAGPCFGQLVYRLWPLLVCAVAGTLAGSGWLTEENARIGTAVLGLILAVYAATGLVSVRFVIGTARQRWAGPLAGGATGLITAATGVSSIPVVPYFQAIGLEKDELVQAMGLSFTVSTVALAVNLAAVDALSWSSGPTILVALAAVLIGLRAGQRVRDRMDPALFRTWFLVALLALGLYLVVRSLS
jgi:hypothetical protein